MRTMIAPFGPRSENLLSSLPPVSKSNFSAFNILLIEDTDEDARLIKDNLNKSDLRPIHLDRASTLAEGLEFLKESPEINIVLLDLLLPDSDGLETFKAVYKEFPHLPIIVLTGLADGNTGIQAVEMGAQNYLEKSHLSPHLINSSIRFAIARNKKSRRMEQAISSARIASWELDTSSNEMRWSPFIYELLKTNEQETPIHTFSDFLTWVHPEDKYKVEEKLLEVMGGIKGDSLDFRLISATYITIFVSFKAEMEVSPLEFKQIVVGQVQDMTDRKRMELLKAEKEVADRSAKLRQDFLARTSHEIRTPLNPILVLTKLLLESHISGQQKEYLEAINAAGKTLLAVVNDILDLSKIEAGKIEFVDEPFNLGQVMAQISDMMESSAIEKGLSFNMKLDPYLPKVVVGDSVRLSQILLNLLSNAIKFTPRGGVSIEVTQLERREKGRVCIRFSVKDTGIGIPVDKQQSIFDSFQQVQSEHVRRQGGTGLGLTIVQKLVQLQGGDVELETKEGLGSCFTFSLEYGMSHTDVANLPLTMETSELRGVKILLAEDNPLNQLVTKKLLSDWGVLLEIASHGREAIDKLRDEAFDLVLMDIQMPVMDGLEATTIIRTQFPEPKASIPIIALTANAFSGTDDECLKAGMNDYVSKPIEIANLYRKIVRYSRESNQLSQNNAHVHPEPQVSIGETPIDFEMAKMTQINLSYLKEVSNGDTDIVRMAIDKYLETTPAYLGNLQNQLRALDYRELSKAAHKLKSSLQFMGLMDLHQLALRIETSCKAEQNMEQLPIWVNEIAQGIEISYPQLREARQSL
ncbi:MAG: response regulator [Bacteroidia bacterium]|nr:response regulator [Bacteroidia bacterium]